MLACIIRYSYAHMLVYSSTSVRNLPMPTTVMGRPARSLASSGRHASGLGVATAARARRPPQKRSRVEPLCSSQGFLHAPMRGHSGPPRGKARFSTPGHASTSWLGHASMSRLNRAALLLRLRVRRFRGPPACQWGPAPHQSAAASRAARRKAATALAASRGDTGLVAPSQTERPWHPLGGASESPW